MKKNIVLTLIVILFYSHVSAHPVDASIDIKGIRSPNGTLFIGWYNSSHGFTKPEKALYRRKMTVGELDNVVVSFENIPAGTYAISVFYDLNNNGQLDKNFLGIPKEPYGFSNNIRHQTRAATFEECAFQLKSNHQFISVSLH